MRDYPTLHLDTNYCKGTALLLLWWVVILKSIPTGLFVDYEFAFFLQVTFRFLNSVRQFKTYLTFIQGVSGEFNIVSSF